MRTADQPIRISLFAPNGRMGKAIATAVADNSDFAIDQDHGDVLVDFSAPDALQASLDRAISGGIPILVDFEAGLLGSHPLDGLAHAPVRREQADADRLVGGAHGCWISEAAPAAPARRLGRGFSRR